MATIYTYPTQYHYPFGTPSSPHNLIVVSSDKPCMTVYDDKGHIHIHRHIKVLHYLDQTDYIVVGD